MFSPTIIVIAIAVVIFMVALIAAIRRIRTCPSDRILVKYGQVGGDRMANAIHGGTTFVWPVIQGFSYLDLTPMTVDIDLRGRCPNRTSASTFRRASRSASARSRN